MLQKWAVLLLVLTSIPVLSCQLEPSGLSSAKHEVLGIRESFAREEFELIHHQASSSFQSTTSESLFKNTLKEHSKEIGDPFRFDLVKWKILTNTEGTFYVVEYEATEGSKIKRDEFVFVLENEKLSLYNYRFQLRD